MLILAWASCVGRATMRPLKRLLVPTLILAVFVLSGCAAKTSPKAEGPPQPDLKVTKAPDGRTFHFDASGSTDPSNDPLTYAWNYTIGNSTEAHFNVTFPETLGNGTLALVLVVRAADGHASATFDKTSLTLGNGNNTPPVTELAKTPRWVNPGQHVRLDASPSPDREHDAINFEWWWGPRGAYDPNKTGPEEPLTEASQDIQTFNTAALNPGQAKTFTFDQAGLYDYSCHPHPWMQGRLLVNATRPSDGEVFVDMRLYAFTNNTLEVGLGTKVTFRNLDVDVHTASAMDYIAGTAAAGTSPVLDVAPPVGEYVARLITTDAKGARSTATWGFKVSDDAPNTTIDQTWTATADQAVGPSRPARASAFTVPYEARLESAALTWTDPTGATRGNVSLDRYKGGSLDAPIPCPNTKASGSPKVTLGPCDLTANADGETYAFTVTAEQGIVAQWSVHALGTVYTDPGFGDHVGLRCHHQGEELHCF